ncbi:MAG: hypothetical protein ACKVW3_04335 [Phycisphaerales bacterium]
MPSMAQPPAGARPVEAGLSDTNPQASPGRNVPLDLRQPTGFSTVYQLKTDSHGGQVFMRIDGGTTAVFPRSVYQSSGGGGLVPSIPPGTVFYVGQLPASLTKSAPARPRPESAIDLTYTPEIVTPSRREPSPPPASLTSWTDETCRVRRVSALLELAQKSDGDAQEHGKHDRTPGDPRP